MISLELSSLLLALLREPAIWKTGATVELARRVGAGMPQSQGFAAIRALRRKLDSSENVRTDLAMQFIHESRRAGLIHDEEQFLLASGHRHVEQSTFLRMRHPFHFRQQQTEQRLFGNRTWEAFQTAGTAQQKNEVAL